MCIFFKQSKGHGIVEVDGWAWEDHLRIGHCFDFGLLAVNLWAPLLREADINKGEG